MTILRGLPILLLFGFWPTTAFAIVLWFGGAESGGVHIRNVIQTVEGFSVSAGTPTAETTHVRSGAYAYQFDAGDAVNVALTLSTDYYVRLFLYATSNPSAQFNLVTCQTSGAVGVTLHVTTDGKLAWSYNNGAVVNTGADSIALSTWNLIQYRCARNASTGGAEVKLNGVTQFSAFSTNTSGVVSDRVAFACGATCGITIWVDDVQIRNDAYPADGRIIARQGRSGTPTDDAWTKNSCTGSVIVGCWSDTPFSASSNVSTATANALQTMLVASFSSTQGGHGSEVINSADTINAAAIGFIWKRSTTNSLGPINPRRIVGGSATDGAQSYQGATTDVWGSEGAVWTATLANLNAMEAGVRITGTPSATSTVEDLWVFVDFTPSPIPVSVRVTQ